MRPQLFGYPLAVLADIEGELVDVSAIVRAPDRDSTIRLDTELFLDLVQERQVKRSLDERVTALERRCVRRG